MIHVIEARELEPGMKIAVHFNTYEVVRTQTQRDGKTLVAYFKDGTVSGKYGLHDEILIDVIDVEEPVDTKCPVCGGKAFWQPHKSDTIYCEKDDCNFMGAAPKLENQS